MTDENFVFKHKNFPRELDGRLSLFRDHTEDRIVLRRIAYLLSSFENKINKSRKNQNKRVSISEENLIAIFDELAFVYCRYLKPDDFKYPNPVELTRG